MPYKLSISRTFSPSVWQTQPVTLGPPAEPGKRKLTLDQGLAVVIAAIISVAGGVAGAFIGRATVSGSHPIQSKSSPHPTGTSSPPTSNIVIRTPRSGSKVKQCPQISGTGHIPAGYGLWIIVVPDTSQQPKTVLDRVLGCSRRTRSLVCFFVCLDRQPQYQQDRCIYLYCAN
jgi:hypothetical protein